MQTHIRSPLEWLVGEVDGAATSVGAERPQDYWANAGRWSASPAVRRIGMADIRYALSRGVEDFAANRTDVVFLCMLYPVIGVVLAVLAANRALLPLLFPLISGFALVCPIAAIGLYEMSRRRERGQGRGWVDVFHVLGSPAIGRIAVFSLALVAIFVAWLFAAWGIYLATLGPKGPVDLGPFAAAVVTTPAGWAMAVLGIGVGFLFALLVFTVSAVTFPLLLDRDVGLDAAIATSARAVASNPRTMALWAAVITAGLVVGSATCMIGLIVVLPVLGHATWHLYRRLVR